MNEKELLEQKCLCLMQLRLTKWQLIWNLEFEINSLETVDKMVLSEAEIAGKLPAADIQKAIQALDMKIMDKTFQIQRAYKDIEMLDPIISKMREEVAV